MKTKMIASMTPQNSTSVYIPLLNLDKDLKKSQYLVHNASIQNLRALDNKKSIDFLKQKFCYRQFISKNKDKVRNGSSSKILSRFKTQIDQNDRSQVVIKKHPQELSFSPQKPMTPSCLASQGPIKERYFQRKKDGQVANNRNKNKRSITQNVQCSLQMIPNNEDKTKIVRKISQQRHSIGFIDTRNPLNLQITALQKKLEQTEKQKQQLMQRMKASENRINQFQEENKQLKQKNKLLQEELRRNSIALSSYMSEQTKLQNHLKARQLKINQLESSLRYSHMQKVALKKIKMENQEQKDTIFKLQKAKQALSFKIKKMNENILLKSPVNKLKRDASDISLNFSQEEDQIKKQQEECETSVPTVRSFKQEKQASQRDKVITTK